MEQLIQPYGDNYAHGAGWWALYLTVMALAVVGMMALFLFGATRAYRQQRSTAEPARETPARETPTRRPAAEGQPPHGHAA